MWPVNDGATVDFWFGYFKISLGCPNIPYFMNDIKNVSDRVKLKSIKKCLDMY